MNARGGHIATIVIAAIIALLLIASLLPPSHVAPDDTVSAPPLLFTGFGNGPTHVEPKVAPTVASTVGPASVALPSRRGRHAAEALPAGSTGIASPYTPPKPITEPKTEDKPVDAKAVFFDVRLTDLVTILLLGLIWWNSWRIWDKIRNFEADYNDPLRDGDRPADAARLDRAAAAMEQLTQAMLEAKATPPEPRAPVVQPEAAPATPAKRPRKAKRVADDLLSGDSEPKEP